MRNRIVGVGVLLVVTTGLAGAAVVTHGLTAPPESAPVAAAGTSQGTDAAADLYPTREDHCYIDGMIPHHEQALELSALVLAADGVRERTRALAEYIVSDQSGEIETMRAWQRAWRKAVPEGGGTHGGHGAGATVAGIALGCDGHGHTEMTGMATPEQLAALGAARGAAADRMFLELMIVHHDGALEMATRVVLEGSNAFARSSGKHVLVEQDREITAMTALLGELS